jgi:hypothetical protein
MVDKMMSELEDNKLTVSIPAVLVTGLDQECVALVRGIMVKQFPESGVEETLRTAYCSVAQLKVASRRWNISCPGSPVSQVIRMVNPDQCTGSRAIQLLK